jgi:hypothetical protein
MSCDVQAFLEGDEVVPQSPETLPKLKDEVCKCAMERRRKHLGRHCCKRRRRRNVEVTYP